MDKSVAIVFRGDDGEVFVLPVEHLQTAKVHESSQDNVLKNLVKAGAESRIGESLCFVGHIDLEKLETSVEYWVGPEPIWPAFTAPKSQDE